MAELETEAKELSRKISLAISKTVCLRNADMERIIKLVSEISKLTDANFKVFQSFQIFFKIFKNYITKELVVDTRTQNRLEDAFMNFVLSDVSSSLKCACFQTIEGMVLHFDTLINQRWSGIFRIVENLYNLLDSFNNIKFYSINVLALAIERNRIDESIVLEIYQFLNEIRKKTISIRFEKKMYHIFGGLILNFADKFRPYAKALVKDLLFGIQSSNVEVRQFCFWAMNNAVRCNYTSVDNIDNTIHNVIEQASMEFRKCEKFPWARYNAIRCLACIIEVNLHGLKPNQRKQIGDILRRSNSIDDIDIKNQVRNALKILSTKGNKYEWLEDILAKEYNQKKKDIDECIEILKESNIYSKHTFANINRNTFVNLFSSMNKSIYKALLHVIASIRSEYVKISKTNIRSNISVISSAIRINGSENWFREMLYECEFENDIVAACVRVYDNNNLSLEYIFNSLDANIFVSLFQNVFVKHRHMEMSLRASLGYIYANVRILSMNMLSMKENKSNKRMKLL